MDKKNTSFILGKSLQSYFYTVLEEINEQILSPLPQEIIFYSSDVLDEYADASRFESDKPLGVSLLESNNLNLNERKRVLKTIGDKSLLLSSYYFESMNKKITNKEYYMKLGKIAYSKLNDISPEHYDVPEFFENLSTRFELLSALCLRLSLQLNTTDEMSYEMKLMEIEDNLSYLEKMITKIHKKSDIAA